MKISQFNFKKNKDDNIYKSEALKLKDKRTLTLVEFQNKVVSKFVAKVIKYMILFKNILTYLRLDYRDASLKRLYLVVIEINILKNRIILTYKNLLTKK